jgi:hypothetical protein
MTGVSYRSVERARETEALLLQALASPGAATELARQTGMSVSAISRWKNAGALQEAAKVIAHLDLRIVSADMRIVPADAVVVDRAAYDFITSTISRLMGSEEGTALVMGVKP